MKDAFTRREVQVNGRWLRPGWSETYQWIAACLYLNEDLSEETRREMAEIAAMDKAEFKRLERRLNSIENALSDFVAETESAASKASSRLKRKLDWNLNETRRVMNERGL
jgi:hypothetical protein